LAKTKEDDPVMRSLISLAQGFLAAIALIWVFNIIELFKGGDAWVGLMYLLIMLIPASSIIYIKLKNRDSKLWFDGPEKWRNLLFSFQGVVLGFWMFDIATTIYSIDITGLAIELNPLGWPLGILGAFVFYAPILCFSYVLLFKIKERVSFYAVIPLTILTLGMGSMNLLAGAQNFRLFVDTAVLPAGVRYELLALIFAVNLLILLALRKMVLQLKPNVKFSK
jgi:hypothetical protein